jgi:hypothetical protein
MAARTTMADLIAKVRQKIGDEPGPKQQFSDQEIQDELDRFRQNVHHAQLRFEYTLLSGGNVSYQDYYSDFTDWETDVVLQDYNFVTITPLTSDYLTGHWTFPPGANGLGQIPHVLLTGKTYDTYRAASVLLDKWSVRILRRFVKDKEEMRYLQAVSKAMANQADEYERLVRPRFIPLERSDVNSWN